jgi:hypothetical protein
MAPGDPQELRGREKPACAAAVHRAHLFSLRLYLISHATISQARRVCKAEKTEPERKETMSGKGRDNPRRESCADIIET